jgi:hypothetical protein
MRPTDTRNNTRRCDRCGGRPLEHGPVISHQFADKVEPDIAERLATAEKLLPLAHRNIEALDQRVAELTEALERIDQRAMAAGGGTGRGPLANIHDIVQDALATPQVPERSEQP